jgi:FMN-dependent NADH-azoreductase
MARLLHVIANPKSEEESVSRRLATHFFRLRHHVHPDEAIETLDLYLEDVPVLDAVTAKILGGHPDYPGAPASGDGDEATFAPEAPSPADSPPPSWALAASDRYAAQFIRSDRIAITTPFWNFGPPAILKAWIDLIVREGRTFEFTGSGVSPLSPGKRILVIGARGGVYGGDSPLRSFDFLSPYLQGLFGFLGAEFLECVWAEGTTHPESREATDSLKAARLRLQELARTF